METRLSECPFCGGNKIADCNDDGLFWKRCTSCGATGPETSKYSGEEGEVVTDWNTRAATPVAGEQERNSLLREPVNVIAELMKACPTCRGPLNACDCLPPLVVTRNGIPCEDQKAALEEFKQACLATTQSSEVARAAEEIVAELDRRALLHDSNAVRVIDPESAARTAKAIEPIILKHLGGGK